VCLEKATELKEISGKFERQLRSLFIKGSKEYSILAERMHAAHKYFTGQLEKEILTPVNEHFQQMQKRSRMRKYINELGILQQVINDKIHEIKQASDLAKGLAEKEDISLLISARDNEKKKLMKDSKIAGKSKTKPEKGDSREISHRMYLEGKTVEEIASERMLQPGTIESHLLPFIRKGELEVYALISKEKYEKLISMLRKRSFASLSEIKYELGDLYSYNEIKATLNHLEYIKSNSV
jgi:hypothetical protein